MRTIPDKLLRARAGLVLDKVFWGSLILRPEYRADESCDTGWTDGRTVGFNPEWIAGLSLGQVKTFLAHEAGHNMLAHFARRGGRDMKKWNVATDYAVNGLLYPDGFERIDGMLYDARFIGMSAESIYDMIAEEGDPGGLILGGPDPGGCGEVRDGADDDGAPSPAAAAALAGDWRVAVGQAVQAAKGRGSLPGGLAAAAEAVVNPVVPWREILMRFLKMTAKNDYCWSRPNRRYIGRGVYLPALQSEALPPIVVAVDTSGSIGGREMSVFSAELNGILEGFRFVDVTAVYADAVVQGSARFTSDDLPVVLTPVGGGGTRFGPVFEWIEKEGLDPACLVYLTDLDGSFPACEPGFPVLWVVPENNGRRAPFGDVVSMRG